jgi:hypothetical protein
VRAQALEGPGPDPRHIEQLFQTFETAALLAQTDDGGGASRSNVGEGLEVGGRRGVEVEPTGEQELGGARSPSRGSRSVVVRRPGGSRASWANCLEGKDSDQDGQGDERRSHEDPYRGGGLGRFC